MSNGLGGFLSGAASQYAHLYGDYEYEYLEDHGGYTGPDTDYAKDFGEDDYDEIPGSDGDNYHTHPDQCPFWYDYCRCSEVEEVDG